MGSTIYPVLQGQKNGDNNDTNNNGNCKGNGEEWRSGHIGGRERGVRRVIEGMEGGGGSNAVRGRRPIVA